MGSGGPFIDPPPPPGYGAPGPGGWGAGSPPGGGGFPPAGGGFPPSGGGFPPSGGGFPPAGGGFPPAGGGSSFPPGSFGPPPEGGGRSRFSGCGIGCLIGIVVLAGVLGTAGFYAWRSWDTVSGWWDDANDAADLVDDARTVASDIQDQLDDTTVTTDTEPAADTTPEVAEYVGEAARGVALGVPGPADTAPAASTTYDVAELTARLGAPPSLGAVVVGFEQAVVDTVEPIEALPPGTRYDVADVEVCLATAGLVPSVTFTEFVLRYADGTEVGASLEPLLRDGFFSSVAGGSCARGWVVFRSPEAAQPTAVVLRTNAYEPAQKPVTLTWTLG